LTRFWLRRHGLLPVRRRVGREHVGPQRSAAESRAPSHLRRRRHCSGAPL